jgi:hypothetical protein
VLSFCQGLFLGENPESGDRKREDFFSNVDSVSHSDKTERETFIHLTRIRNALSYEAGSVQQKSGRFYKS